MTIDKNNHGSGICPYESNCYDICETSCGVYINIGEIGKLNWKYYPWCGRVIFHVPMKRGSNED